MPVLQREAIMDDNSSIVRSILTFIFIVLVIGSVGLVFFASH
jgi:hypothetical protein